MSCYRVVALTLMLLINKFNFMDYGGMFNKIKSFHLNVRDEKQGFTLLEVLVAVTILGLAYVAILQNFSVSTRNIIRLEKNMTSVLERSIAFDQALMDPESEEYDIAESETPFLEGLLFNLVVISDKQGDYSTLKLSRR